MIEITENVIDQIALAIASEINPVKAFLFGSYARGNATLDSDIDILIVEDKPFTHDNSRRNEILRIRRALSFIKHPKDVLLYSSDEIDKWKNSKNHVVAQCLSEGKVIYERH